MICPFQNRRLILMLFDRRATCFFHFAMAENGNYQFPRVGEYSFEFRMGNLNSLNYTPSSINFIIGQRFHLVTVYEYN